MDIWHLPVGTGTSQNINGLFHQAQDKNIQSHFGSGKNQTQDQNNDMNTSTNNQENNNNSNQETQGETTGWSRAHVSLNQAIVEAQLKEWILLDNQSNVSIFQTQILSQNTRQ